MTSPRDEHGPSACAARERRKRFPSDVLAAIDTPPDERTGLQRQLYFWSDRQITVSESQDPGSNQLAGPQAPALNGPRGRRARGDLSAAAEVLG